MCDLWSMRLCVALVAWTYERLTTGPLTTPPFIVVESGTWPRPGLRTSGLLSWLYREYTMTWVSYFSRLNHGFLFYKMIWWYMINDFLKNSKILWKKIFYHQIILENAARSIPFLDSCTEHLFQRPWKVLQWIILFIFFSSLSDAQMLTLTKFNGDIFRDM